VEWWKNGRLETGMVEEWNDGKSRMVKKWWGNKGLKEWNHRTKPQRCAVFQSSFQYSNIPFFNIADAKS
jgi:hypothetical protein